MTGSAKGNCRFAYCRSHKRGGKWQVWEDSRRHLPPDDPLRTDQRWPAPCTLMPPPLRSGAEQIAAGVIAQRLNDALVDRRARQAGGFTPKAYKKCQLLNVKNQKWVPFYHSAGLIGIDGPRDSPPDIMHAVANIEDMKHTLRVDPDKFLYDLDVATLRHRGSELAAKIVREARTNNACKDILALDLAAQATVTKRWSDASAVRGMKPSEGAGPVEGYVYMNTGTDKS